MSVSACPIVRAEIDEARDLQRKIALVWLDAQFAADRLVLEAFQDLDEHIAYRQLNLERAVDVGE